MSNVDSVRIDPDESRAERDVPLLQRISVPIVGAVILLGLMVLSVFVGSGDIPISEVWRALTDGGDDTVATIVNDYRVPRTILAVLGGASLAVAGAVIQALTRNPLADPGILGVNSGAYLFVVIAAAFFGVTGVAASVGWGMAGAMIAACVVYAIGSSGRAGGTPAKMVLAGVAFGSLLSGISFAITLLLPKVFDKVRYWQVGSVEGRQFDSVTGIVVFVAIGLVLALFLARPLNGLAMGDDLAVSLGINVRLTRVLSFVAITLLCGACTAVVGPISFVGLMVPHIARALVGANQLWILLTCLILGPMLFLVADMIGRVVVSTELPVGLVTAFLGAPVLIWLVRRGKAAG